MNSSRTHGAATALAAFALTAMIPLCGTGAAYASDASTGAGGVLLSPAKISQTVHPGTVTIPVTLRNTSTSTQAVTLSAAPLAHTLDGVAYPGTQTAGSAPLLTFDRSTVELSAEQTQTIDAHATVDPAGGLYAALLADVAPAAGTSAASSVTSRIRLVSIVELASDTAPAGQIRIAAITAAKGTANGDIRLNAVVHNDGAVAVAPAGHVVVMSGNTQLADLPLAAAAITPGNARRTSADWTAAPGSLDSVRVHVMLTNPGADAWSTITFAAGQPEQSAAVITDLRYDSSTGQAQLTVTNTGTLPVTGGEVTLQATSRDAAGASANITLNTLAPGQRRDLNQPLRLDAGHYLLTATLTTHGSTLDTVTANAIVTATPASSGDGWLWWVLPAGVCCAGLAGLGSGAAAGPPPRPPRPSYPSYPSTSGGVDMRGVPVGGLLTDRWVFSSPRETDDRRAHG